MAVAAVFGVVAIHAIAANVSLVVLITLERRDLVVHFVVAGAAVLFALHPHHFLAALEFMMAVSASGLFLVKLVIEIDPAVVCLDLDHLWKRLVRPGGLFEREAHANMTAVAF